MEKEKVAEIEKMCRSMREDCLRMAVAAGKEGFHFGATLSLIEIVATLYFDSMKIGKDKLDKEDRDRLLLSKGHGVPAVYAALKQMGVLKREDLETFKKDETYLYGHPSMNQKMGIEISSGSLGQGLSFAVGSALALRRKGNFSSNIFVILGDGECNEGAVWEAALSAAKYQLNNIVTIIDCNGLQYDGKTKEILPMESLEEKWRSFGFSTMVIDGHDISQCSEAFSKQEEQPLAVIAKTVKGKGISFMENDASWHHKIMTKDEEIQAWKEVTGSEV
jgi:transketolase